MHKKLLLVLVLFFSAFAAQAQPVTAKKGYVARILKQQQGGVEMLARAMAERPAQELMERAANVLSTRIAPDKREALAKSIQLDVKKYLDDAVPLVRDRAVRLAPTTIGSVLEEKFSEDELKQLADFMDSPASAKYQQLNNDMQKALLEKLLADTRGTIEPKIAALDQSVSRKLGVPAAGAGPSTAAPAAPAAAPAK